MKSSDDFFLLPAAGVQDTGEEDSGRELGGVQTVHGLLQTQ